jgi:hypothetical protein
VITLVDPSNTIQILRYEPSRSSVWNAWVAAAKNGSFLFQRGYMDYHADRFSDHSLMFVQNGELIAILPANERDGVLQSHGGLTYGGLVVGRRMKSSLMLHVLEALVAYLRERDFKKLIYKAVPHIYHAMPAEEDLYALFRMDAKLIRRDVSSAIASAHREPLSKGRKWSSSRLAREQVEIGESLDYAGFMAMLAAHLQARHGVDPTHTSAEMLLLSSRFPANIRLFVAKKNETLLGGVLMYLNARVAHAQYIASTPEGRAVGATDGVILHILDRMFVSTPYFDFGISTENSGRYLNSGLASYKEGFGARAVVYDTYALDVA